jgi:hypothetical protein
MKRTAEKTSWLRIGVACAAAVFILGFAGCALFGGGANDSIQRVKGYRLQPPDNWQKTDSHGESDEAYRLPSGAIATATSSCGRNSRQSPEILTKQLLIGARHVQVTRRERIVVNGKNALQSSVTAKLEGVPFNLELIVVSSTPCAFDFSLVSPETIPETERTQFAEYAKSLKYGTN